MAYPSHATTSFVAAVLFVTLSVASPALGRTTHSRTSPLSEESIRRAVAALPVPPLEALQADWARVERLAPGSPIVVRLEGGASLDGELVSVDGGGLTVRRRSGDVVSVARPSVIEIRDVTRRGSKRNAIIGAGAGAFLGYLTALNIALRDCGGNCNDERFLVGLALVGTPVAGGLIGYHAFARRNELVYRRSAGAFTPADPATRSLATAP